MRLVTLYLLRRGVPSRVMSMHNVRNPRVYSGSIDAVAD
jgi:hypothetical protein